MIEIKDLKKYYGKNGEIKADEVYGNGDAAHWSAERISVFRQLMPPPVTLLAGYFLCNNE